MLRWLAVILDTRHLVKNTQSYLLNYYKNVTGALPTFDCFTEGQLSFGISHTNCTGSELHIDNCTHTNPSLHDCTTHKDAGVICQGMH